MVGTGPDRTIKDEQRWREAGVFRKLPCGRRFFAMSFRKVLPLPTVAVRFAAPCPFFPSPPIPAHPRHGHPIIPRRCLCWVRRSPPLRPHATSYTASCLPAASDDLGRALLPSHLRARDCLLCHAPLDFQPTSCAPEELMNEVRAQKVDSVHPASSSEQCNFLEDAAESAMDTGDDHERKKSIEVSSHKVLNINHAVMKLRSVQETRWFPYLDQFRVKDKVVTSSQILDILSPYLQEDRKKRIERVVLNRTYSICPVVEGLLDLGNIAAVFRSADALGFQSVHVISNETDKRYKKNKRVSMGSEKWLDAELFVSTKGCFEELKSRGYRIAVTSIANRSVPIFDMDWTIPTAVVFGNEFRGVSEDAIRLADVQCYIPMHGMVDSFNVSVAAGIVLHHAVNHRKAQLGKHGDLSPEEQRILSADFYLRHSYQSLSILERLVLKKQEMPQTSLRSVLLGELENDVDLPDYLKIDLEQVNL